MVVTLVAKLGGEKTLRQNIDVFIDRVFSDRMIGSFYRTANKSRIKAMEYRLSAEFLGGGVTYKGKPLDQALANRPIMNRDFMRRTQRSCARHWKPSTVPRKCAMPGSSTSRVYVR